MKQDLKGRDLGRYHIIEALGEGGMAAVYKALDTALERIVAVKIIRRERSDDPDFVRRFDREARTLAKLEHPGIVPVHDYGEHEGILYLVMSYIRGGTLKERMGQPLSVPEAASLLIPLCEAMAYAHDQQVIHRDLKPANVLITEGGQPMLTDFGIAKVLDPEGTQMTQTGIGVGTPDYMAPEQWSGQVDPRCDIYALGVILYELVTGRRPYMADTPMAVMLKSVNDPLPLPRQFAPDLPETAEMVILKSLAKQPEDRYADMNAFAAALHKLAEGGVPEGLAPPKRKALWRSPAVIGVLAGLAVVALAAILLNAAGWLPPGMPAPTAEQASAAPTQLTTMGNAGPAPTQVEATVAPTQKEATPLPTLIDLPELPDAVADFLLEPVAVLYEDFDQAPNPAMWANQGGMHWEDGIVEIRSDGQDDIGLDGRGFSMQGNQGLLLLFSYEEGSEFRFALETAEIYSGMPGNRLLELFHGPYPGFNASGYEIESNNFSLEGMMQPQPGRWYFGLLTVDSDGEALAAVWDRDDPGRRAVTRQPLGEMFAGQTWQMISNCWNGAFFIDSITGIRYQGYP